MKNKLIGGFGIFLSLYISVFLGGGCAQIGAPTGGTRDSLAPVLVRATPGLKAINFRGNRITLFFDEYVELQEIQNNLLISPLPKSNPTINSSLKTISIKLKDSLLPNTTYSIQFGNAIRDINEGNIYPNFTYVFSTGNSIDSLSLAGKVLLAESGMPDSTVSVLLYRNNTDSAVQTLKPDYRARLKADGSFLFENLPPASFKIYALKDGDGSKNYNSKSELFAFYDSTVQPGDSSEQIMLNAYAEEPLKDNKTIRVLKPVLEKKLKFTNSLQGNQDLLSNLTLNFNNPLKSFDSSSLTLRDTNYAPIPGGMPVIDSTRKILSYNPGWSPGKAYTLILDSTSLQDSAGNRIALRDTLNFIAKNVTEYGRVIFRFKNYDQSKNPVLQLFSGQALKYSFALTGATWENSRIAPGEYDIRILLDSNQDGLWTPGNYSMKRQPEKALTLPQKLSVKADWDNERDLTVDFLEVLIFHHWQLLHRGESLPAKN